MAKAFETDNLVKHFDDLKALNWVTLTEQTGQEPCMALCFCQDGVIRPANLTQNRLFSLCIKLLPKQSFDRGQYPAPHF